MVAGLPKITVITVTRNAAATLAQALESAVAQNYPNLEFLLLDAASTDGTVDVIKRYEPHLAHWRSHADDGPNSAYNEGIARATGDLVTFLNADDWYEPGILHAIGEAFAAYPSDVITCEARAVKMVDGSPVETRRYAGKNLALTPLGTPMPNARFFKRELFQHYGNFKVQNHQGTRMIASDLEFLLRLSQHPLHNHIIPRLGYTYVEHEGSITFGNNPARNLQMYEERAALAEHYLPLLPAYRARLKRWHRRGTARIFWHYGRCGEKRKAWQALKSGLRLSPARWPLECLRLAGRKKLF